MLDRTAGGPALHHVKNRDYLFDHTSKDQTTYAADRRSVYLPVIRNNLYDVFQLFDAPDAAVPTGDRATTTVATQALFFLNSDLATAAPPTRWPGALLGRPDLDDAGRVRLLFATGLRPPADRRRRPTRTLASVAGVRGGVRRRGAGRRQAAAEGVGGGVPGRPGRERVRLRPVTVAAR